MKRSSLKKRVFMTSLGLVSLAVLLCDHVKIPRPEPADHPYEIVDIGGNLFANDINDHGQVVGMTGTGVASPRAFVWSLSDGIDYIPGSEEKGSLANGINNRGEIVGQAKIETAQRSAFLWEEDSGPANLADILGPESMAYAVNSYSQVVGHAAWKKGPFHQAFLYEPGSRPVPLGTFGGSNSDAVAISDSGSVVGWSQTQNDEASHAFRWSSEEGLIDLETLGGANSHANAVNNRNQVVGQAEKPTGSFHAFLNSNGEMADLGTLGGAWSVALGINDTGLVVGQSALREGALDTLRREGRHLLARFFGPAAYADESHAFVWSDGVMADLNDLVAKEDGWQVLSAATGVNENGEIVGFGVKDGSAHAFLLVPREGRVQRVAKQSKGTTRIPTNPEG